MYTVYENSGSKNSASDSIEAGEIFAVIIGMTVLGGLSYCALKTMPYTGDPILMNAAGATAATLATTKLGASGSAKLAAGKGIAYSAVMKTGLAAGFVKLGLVTGGALFVFAAASGPGHYVKDYMTRYPVSDNMVDSAITKLKKMYDYNLTNKISDLHDEILMNYSSSMFSSSNSSSFLYAALKQTVSAREIYYLIHAYLNKSDGKGGHYNNGKRLFVLITDWIKRQPEPVAQNIDNEYAKESNELLLIPFDSLTDYAKSTCQTLRFFDGNTVTSHSDSNVSSLGVKPSK